MKKYRRARRVAGYISWCCKDAVYMLDIIIIIDIQPLGRFGQRPELSQSTGIALVRCILGKFLGVVCHCFPPRLDVPTFAAEGGTVGENVVR